MWTINILSSMSSSCVFHYSDILLSYTLFVYFSDYFSDLWSSKLVVSAILFLLRPSLKFPNLFCVYLQLPLPRTTPLPWCIKTVFSNRSRNLFVSEVSHYWWMQSNPVPSYMQWIFQCTNNEATVMNFAGHITEHCPNSLYSSLHTPCIGYWQTNWRIPFS